MIIKVVVFFIIAGIILNMMSGMFYFFGLLANISFVLAGIAAIMGIAKLIFRNDFE